MSRRKLLAATGVLGGGGFFTGFTSARMSERESTRNELTSGMLDLEVSGDGDSESDGSVTFEFDELEPGETGSSTIELDLPQGAVKNNPAYLWARTSCPISNQLAKALDVTLWYVVDEDDDRQLFNGTLCELANEFRGGVPLDADQNPTVEPGRQTCLNTLEQSPLTLRLNWELDELVENDSTTLTFEFGAIACRHEDGTTNPFDSNASGCLCTPRQGISYVSLYHVDDGECVPLGKLELNDDSSCPGTEDIGNRHIPRGTYPLYQEHSCETDYQIDVLGTTINSDGKTVAMEFAVTSEENPNPTLCQAIVKNGQGCAFYGPNDFVKNATRGEFAAPIRGEGSTCPGSGGENK